MPKRKDDRSYVWDMLESSRTVRKFISGKSFHEFLQDEILRLAVERKLEIIGEAASHLPPELTKNHPNIPWKVIIGQRHVLAHDYDEIRYERLWNVCQKDLPILIEQLEALLLQLTRENEQ